MTVKSTHRPARRGTATGRGKADARATAAAQDISEPEPAKQEQLRHVLELLDHTGQLAKVGGWQLDLDTEALRWTKETYRIHEVDPEFRPSVATAIQFYAPEARPVITAAVQAAIDAGTPFDVELPLMTALGRRIWVRAQGIAKRRDGRTIRLYGAFQDITEQRATDESRRLESAALHASADAIVITDPAGVIERVNPAFTRLTGYTAEEAIGKNPRDLVRSGKHDAAFYRELWETILAGRAWRGDTINRRKDGSLYTERQTITPLVDATGAITHFVAIKKDITERLQLEAQLRQAQKMEVVGQLTSGIAHDFNNLLTAILGYCDLLLDDAVDDGRRADLEEIKKAGVSAASLTSRLLAFSRKQLIEPKILDLNAVVTDTGHMLQRMIGEDVEIDFRLASALDRVQVDPGQMHQVLMNLVVNARDAMPRGGKLTIETANVHLDETYAASHLSVVPGPHVMLAVADTGTGMTPDVQARLFEPFFTTKEPGKGTGLGLASTYGIVKQSAGNIWVYSEPGHGTTFKIYFPRAEKSEALTGPADAPATLTGDETILVVEDSFSLRTLVSKLLQRYGYSVLLAATPDDAMRLCAEHGDSVHLLLTDIVMPGMSGPSLASELAAQHPGMRPPLHVRLHGRRDCAARAPQGKRGVPAKTFCRGNAGAQSAAGAERAPDNRVTTPRACPAILRASFGV